MSYDSRLDNFDKLIKLLASVTLYVPNEADLKVTALTTQYNDLKAKNTAVVTATTPLSNARISRNDILYKPNTGLVIIALDTKTYIKSLYGATSQQYKQVSKRLPRNELTNTTSQLRSQSKPLHKSKHICNRRGL